MFDVGGYLGDWTERLLLKNECTVFVFEPVHNFYKKICQRFEGESNVKVFCFGLDSYSHEGVISHEADGSSQYHGTEKEAEKTVYKSILDFMKEESIDEVSLMKLNIEGGEYDILEYLIETGEILKFKNLQIQFHDIKKIRGKQRMKIIQKKLEMTHELQWAYRPFIHESWRRK